MAIIDSQVHAYEANSPKRPWHSVPNWPDHVTGDEMVAAMDKVGVDGAIFISAFSLYRYNSSYAVEVQRAHPGRLAIVKPLDPDDPGVAEIVAEWKKTPGAVGIRVMLRKEEKRAADDPGLDRIARAAVRYDFPLNILCWDNLDAGTALIDRHPDTRFIIDHLGILQPRVPPAPPNLSNLGPIFQKCSNSPNVRMRDQGQRRLHAVARTVSVSRIYGTRSGACSMPGVSIAACGARTGRGRSPSSTTSRPSSPFSGPAA